MADENVKPTGCTWIHGIGSSTAIDTSSEIVDLAGLDCSSLIGAPFSWEHKNDQPNQLVGKILEYKKIFSEKDCEKNEHKYFWDKCKVPYLYVMGRLFDDKKDSSKECAALFLDDAEHPDEHPMVGFSVEGSKISKVGMVVDKSIARRITVTNNPANKTCVAEIVKNPDAKVESDEDSIFKSEPTYTIELLQKAEAGSNPMVTSTSVIGTPDHIVDAKPGDVRITGTKTSTSAVPNKNKMGKKEVPGSKIPAAHPAPSPSKAVKGAPGWKHTGGGNFHHPSHGTVSVIKQGPEFHVKHNGALAGVGGKKGIFGSSKEAGGHAGDYMRSLSQGKTAGPKMHERPSPSMAKAMTAGSGMAAPGNLVQGAALAPESVDKKMKKALWFRKAEECYKLWEKREQFENFMAKHLPGLTKGEISAIGATLALRKSMRAEAKLKKMMRDEGQDSWVKKSEKPKKPPELKGIVESEVSHTEADPYLKGRETVHLKSGHKLEGHPAGKFKVGDRVVAQQHLMGTHLLNHKK